MKVLMITGDRNLLKPGTEASRRLELQRAMCERLEVVYWGRGSLFSKLPKGSFDVVTTQDPFWRGLLGWYAAKRKRAKLNVQVHTDLDAQPLVKHVLGQIVLLHADCIRVVSEKLKQQVLQKGVRVPVSVLPIYINLDIYRSVFHRNHEGKNILWVGRFESEKNPAVAIDIFRIIVREIPDAKLIVLGKGSLESSLKEQAKGLPIEFAGWTHPLNYLEIADVVLSTSKHESWGASIIEALAAGVPVVAPDVGVAQEAGAIVVPREKLSEAIIEVLKTRPKGELKLHLPAAEEWARAWYEGMAECAKK